MTAIRSASAPLLRPVPGHAPPYDDEPGATPAASSPVMRSRLRLVPAIRPRSAPGLAAPPAIRALAQAVAEVLAGTRPAAHLDRRLSPQAQEAVRDRVFEAVTRPRLRSAWLSPVADDVVEVSAVVACGWRVHALALRLEREDGQWRCAAVEARRPSYPVSPITRRPFASEDRRGSA